MRIGDLRSQHTNTKGRSHTQSRCTVLSWIDESRQWAQAVFSRQRLSRFQKMLTWRNSRSTLSTRKTAEARAAAHVQPRVPHAPGCSLGALFGAWLQYEVKRSSRLGVGGRKLRRKSRADTSRPRGISRLGRPNSRFGLEELPRSRSGILDPKSLCCHDVYSWRSALDTVSIW